MAILGMFSGKGNHPLADPKKARAALAALSVANPLAAIEDISAWLEPLPGVDDLKLDRRIEIIEMLDDTGGPAVRRLARDYLTAPKSGKAREHRMWAAGQGYWQKLIAAYNDCLERLAPTPRALGAARYALLCARQLNAYGTRLKWDQFRYGPVDSALWEAAGRIYLLARTNKFFNRPVQLYSNATEMTSVEAEYLRLLVFHTSSMDKLLPLETELAERLISFFLPNFALTDTDRPEHGYWVDATHAQPPCRLAKEPEPSPTLLYFSTSQALDAVEKLVARIERIKGIPADLPLGGQYPVAAVNSVLLHLAVCWAPKPPMRTSDRHSISSLLAVIHDMGEIRTRLVGDDGAQEGETWIAENVSQGGMAARVPLGSNPWVRVGSLIGLRPERSEQWLVGLIRRFARESQALGAVGIETIGKTPHAVEITCSGLRSEAILLESPVHEGDTVSLVIPARAWEDFLPVTFGTDGTTVRLSPIEICHTGDDFLIGRYRVTAVE